MLTYLGGPEATKCLFNFTLENRIISVTWLKVQRRLMVQDVMRRSRWAAVRPRPCGTPCCQRGGIAVAGVQLLVAPQSLNQLIFGAGDCQTAALQL